MVKVALLIGVSEYQIGWQPLPGAVRDVEAMRRVLQHLEMGNFDDVKSLPNPDPSQMQEEIETLFSNLKKEDLALLFFSGHGAKDDSGRLYLTTRLTRKNQQGDLLKSTAVPASFVQDIMSNSRSRQQVVILDCCFSGAFAQGLLAKDDSKVDVKAQLGGRGRAILTSSDSTQYSFATQDSLLSVYTRYLIEGIETGAADFDNNGVITVDELHEYAKNKVKEAAPAMEPKIYAVEEGYRIQLAQAAIGDPKLSYRREVERYKNQGEIPFVGHSVLDSLRDRLGLLPEEAAAIEVEVLKPYREYQEKLQRYEQVFSEAMQREKPLSANTRQDLKRLQQVLGLREEDVAPIEQRATTSPVVPSPAVRHSHKFEIAAATVSGLLGFGGLIGLFVHLHIPKLSNNQSPSGALSTPTVTPTPKAAVPPATTNRLEGVDVSFFNGDLIDWKVVAQGGISFALIKATEGATTTDPTFATNWANLKSAGIVRGGYHFFRSDKDAEVQAKLFLKTVKLEPGDLPPILDVEISKKEDISKVVFGISKWLTIVEKATGRRPILATQPVYWRDRLEDLKVFAAYPLWIVENDIKQPDIPGGWNTWVFWTYSDAGAVEGIQGNASLDRFNGSLDDLHKFIENSRSGSSK